MKKIIFVDRDGTLIIEPEDQQIDSLEKLAFVEGAIPALKTLVDAGWVLVLVSNQDGLGSSSFPQKAFDAPQAMMLQILKSAGIVFEDICICPHRPEDHCFCRKPKTGLLLEHIAKGFDRLQSAVIGDRETDLELGKALGIEAFKLSKEMSWENISQRLLGRSRRATRVRETKETCIRVDLDLDHFQSPQIKTGLSFFDHMLEQIAQHSGISLSIVSKGDWDVDDHHPIEDTAIALGEALREALGDKHGIQRYGFVLPMDESLAQCTLDLSGRAFCDYNATFTREKVGGMGTEMFSHFFHSLADGLRSSIHLSIKGQNNHHIAEAGFKAFGRCLGQAVQRTAQGPIPSSKGVL